MSRERDWQRAQIAAGKCMLCAKTRNLYANYCDEHAVKHAECERRRAGNEPWRPGGKGRPPKKALLKGENSGE